MNASLLPIEGTMPVVVPPSVGPTGLQPGQILPVRPSKRAPLERQLQELLNEEVEQAVRREEATLAAVLDAASPHVVLFGAGSMGRKSLVALRDLGIEPFAFADNNEALWGKKIDGVLVISPAEAVEAFGRTATFIVTIWSPGAGCAKAQSQLRNAGCKEVVSFIPLFWKDPEPFGSTYGIGFPHKVLRERSLVQEALSVWADAASREEYVAQVQFRLQGDVDAVPPAADYEQYFPEDIFMLRDDETFVDCGAFDGDTLQAFLFRQGESFSRIVAFEPDEANFQKLQQYVAELPAEIASKIELARCAVGAAKGTVRFAANGTGASAIGEDGNVEVECIALDGVSAAATATYVKMDIEGAEADALGGARRLIQERLPVLAVAVYHHPEDLWRLPLLIRSLSPEYHLFLRPHDSVFDLVCYAVPKNRLCK